MYCILNCTEYGLEDIPQDSFQVQQWHKPINCDDGPGLFSEIPFVRHVDGKRKAGECDSGGKNRRCIEYALLNIV